jgi:pilus assembly protein CpaC
VPAGTSPLAPPGDKPADEPIDSKELLTQYEEPTKEIFVYSGRSKLVETKRPITRVVIALPAVADLQLLDADQPNPKLIAIYGRAFGSTNLTIWDDQDHVSTYLVRVTIDTKDLEKRIKTLFPGAEVHVEHLSGISGNGQIVLTGQVPDAKTMAEVLSLVTSTLLGSGLGSTPGVSATSVSGAGGPGGSAPQGGATPGGGGGGQMMGGSAMQMQGTAAGAGGGGMLPPGTIINRVNVPGPRQVMLHVKIAELNRTALRQIGVSWLDTRNQAILGSAVGGAGAVGASLTNTSGVGTQFSSIVPGAFTQGAPRAPTVFQPVATNLSATATAASLASSQLFGVFNAGEFNLFINALRVNQLAKILAEPNLMTLDGQPARFLAGGSFPFPVPQSSAVGGASVAVTIQFRDFGAILQFVPFILHNDVIRLDVEPSFSELNPATGVSVLGTTVPGINQRSARTVVELREGQTLAIAGLLQLRTTGTTSRVPGLGDLPIVGPWFSQTNLTTVETELVVLVTPELVAPMEKGEVPPSPGDRVLQPNDYEFYFLGRIEGRTGHPFRATVQEFDPLEVMKHFQSENTWVVGPHGHAD